jgi:DNA-binding XRE family transcriptional regulator
MPVVPYYLGRPARIWIMAMSGSASATAANPAATASSASPPPAAPSARRRTPEEISADVAQAHAEAEEMDRIYAMNLAMIRKAAQMTQVEVARKLEVGQGALSRLENRGYTLLSTLYDYLTATGADAASIVVTVHGHKIALDLGRIHDTAQPEQRSA